jgi:hypothetical protein
MKKKNICITYLVLFLLFGTIIGCGSHSYESKKVTEETTTTTENPVGEETQTTTKTTVETE